MLILAGAMDTTLSKKLKRLRAARGWPQKEVLDRMGISQSTLSEWERGIRAPGYDQLLGLAELYEISLVDLVKDEGSVYNFQNSTHGIGSVDTYNGLTTEALLALRKHDNERFDRIEKLMKRLLLPFQNAKAYT